MNEKLLFLKNLLSQVEELSLKQKELQQAKDQIHLTGNVDINGEMKIGSLTLSLNELTKEVPSSISSNLKMLLSQYIEHLIQKNNQLQQDLLSNVQISHIKEVNSITTNEEKVSISTDEKKNVHEPIVQPVTPTIPNKEPVLVEEKEKKNESLLLSLHEKTMSRLERAVFSEEIRKMIAEEFYSFKTGEYIKPEMVQSQIEEKTGIKVERETILDIGWVLFSQDVIEIVYHICCDNGHEDYLRPPLPKDNTCPVCKKEIRHVDISFKKL